jgi:predicted TIM-barrel fold metal-dependent hydrolase
MNWDCHVHIFGPAAQFPVASARGYTPPVRTLAQVEELAAAAGIAHLVLVQPSVYGTDLFCLLEALRAGAGRHRGVAVVGAGISGAQLENLHALGVRGVRFNLVSPDGNSLEDFDEIARKIAPLGWHIQFLIAPEDLRRVQALRRRTAAVPFVFDHFAGLTTAHGQDGEHAGVLRELMVRDDCWIKLSGFYRLTGDRAYRDLDPLLLELATVAPDRILWGSDWPHTWYFEAKRGSPPAYAATLAPLDRCLPPELRQKALQNNPWKLYL